MKNKEKIWNVYNNFSIGAESRFFFDEKIARKYAVSLLSKECINLWRGNNRGFKRYSDYKAEFFKQKTLTSWIINFPATPIRKIINPKWGCNEEVIKINVRYFYAFRE
jgi:hypothetical protein